jgi:arylsulfatase A-like enzyme
VVDAQVRTIDIFPTLLEAAGLKTTTKVDGDSLLPLLEPGAGQDSRPAYAEALIAHDLNAVHLMRSRPDDGILHAWSDGRFKLIHKPLRPERGELYDLLEDPGETDNLYDRRLDVVRRLLTEMETIAPYATDDFGSGDDSEVIERLRSLGYVE